MTRTAWLLFAALSVVWGVPYFFIKIALADLSPAWTAFGRVALSALLLAPFVPRREWRALRPKAAAVAAVALADVALPFYLIANGERVVSSSLTGIILASIPITVALLGLGLKGREPVSRVQAAGLALGIAGVVALLGVNVGRGFATPSGVALICAAMLSYSAGVLMIKYWLHDAPQFGTTAAMLAVAAVALAPPALASFPAHRPGVAAVGAIVVLGPLCTAVAYIMYFALIERAGAIRATVVTYVNPAVAVLLGVLLLHEPISIAAVGGLVLIVLGSWLSTGSAQSAPRGALSVRRLGNG